MSDHKEKELMNSNQRSPSNEAKILEHKIKMENIETTVMWKSCISDRETDARLLRFIMKSLISLVVLGVSFYGLLNAGPCDNLLPFYTALISGIISSWISTSNKSEKK
jgi:hypothetical protein